MGWSQVEGIAGMKLLGIVDASGTLSMAATISVAGQGGHPAPIDRSARAPSDATGATIERRHWAIAVIMRFWGAVLLLLLPFTVSPVRAECGAAPQDVQDFLRTEAGWSIIDTSDLYEPERGVWEQRDVWERYRGAGPCPGLAEGNFFGNDKLAYALALKKTIGGHTFEKLVVISRSGEKFITTELVPQKDVAYENESAPVIFVVWKTVPGTYRDEDSGKSITIKSDPIVYEHVEQPWSTIYYYYSEGAFKSLHVKSP
jgi:hypothetical protein